MNLQQAKDFQKNLDNMVNDLNNYILNNTAIGMDVMLTVTKVEGVCLKYPMLTATVSVDPTEIE